MPVLIDGNNLLHAAWNDDPDRPVGRMLLCRRLGDWARRFRRRVHVVFDGARPRSAFARQIADPRIEITFSGAGRSADEVLIALIAGDSAPRRLLVVSSDREIVRAARRRRAAPVRSDAFWRRVQTDLARPRPRRVEPEQKRAGASPQETDEWMRELGLDSSPDDDPFL